MNNMCELGFLWSYKTNIDSLVFSAHVCTTKTTKHDEKHSWIRKNQHEEHKSKTYDKIHPYCYLYSWKSLWLWQRHSVILPSKYVTTFPQPVGLVPRGGIAFVYFVFICIGRFSIWNIHA